MAPLALVCVRRAGHRRLGERDAYLQTYIELDAHLEWIVSVNSALFYQQSDGNSSQFSCNGTNSRVFDEKLRCETQFLGVQNTS